MKDRIRSVCEKYLTPDGELQWPADEAARNKLGSRLLGACVVAAMDQEIETSLPSLQSDFSEEQQRKVRHLLAQAVRGVVFSILVKLDQFPCADLDLVLSRLESQERLGSIVEGDSLDFHDRLWNWIEEFSEYPREFGV
jgi:hypothetical protein